MFLPIETESSLAEPSVGFKSFEALTTNSLPLSCRISSPLGMFQAIFEFWPSQILRSILSSTFALRA